jgi:hypothetical protein
MTISIDATDEALLAECEVHTYRASGPGGQKRNKTESAVRLVHRPTGISVIGTESRSQHENRARALKRLRKALALRVRRPIGGEGVPDAISAAIGKDGRLRVGQRDARYLPAAGAVLDLLAACNGSVAGAADRAGVTTGNLSSFITTDGELLAEANRIRAARGLRPLRQD